MESTLKKLIAFCTILFCLFAVHAEARQWTYAATSLTGGGTGALDAIDGQNLQEGDIAHVTTSAYTYEYYLSPDSGAAESSPAIIMPNVNAGTKRWILSPINTTKIYLLTSNGGAGTVTLTASAVTTFVSNTSVTANSLVFLYPASNSASGVTTYISAITSGVSFRIIHTNTSDVDKTFNYLVIN